MKPAKITITTPTPEMKVPFPLLSVCTPRPRRILPLLIMILIMVLLLGYVALMYVNLKNQIAQKSLQIADEVDVLVALKSEQSADEVTQKSEQSADEVIPKSEQSADEVTRKSEQSADEVTRKSEQSADEVTRKSEQSADEVTPKSEQSADEVAPESEQSADEVTRKSEQSPKSEQSADEVTPESEQSADEVTRKSEQSADEVTRKSEQSPKSEQSADEATPKSERSPKSEQSADEVDVLTRDIHERVFKAKAKGGVMTAMKNCSDPASAVRFTCVDTNCSRQFPTSLKARVRQLLGEPRFRLSQQQKDGIKELSGKVPNKRFIFVTAASSNHFKPSLKLFSNLAQTVFNKLSPESYSFYYYDLGLNTKERRHVEKTCNCTVKTFNASLLPREVQRLSCYTWKPLIVQALLPYAEVLVYMDSSIRFPQDVDLDLVFDTARYRGAQLLFTDDAIPNHTVEDMFEFYGDMSCQYWPYREVAACLLVLHKQPFVQRLIVEPWAACAFHPGCMCPPHTTLNCPHKERKVGQCHRFDQSSLSMLLVKLLGHERRLLALNFWPDNRED